MQDPVCGFEVSYEQAEEEGLLSVYNGQEFAFCCDICQFTFEAHPHQFVARHVPPTGRAKPPRDELPT